MFVVLYLPFLTMIPAISTLQLGGKVLGLAIFFVTTLFVVAGIGFSVCSIRKMVYKVLCIIAAVLGYLITFIYLIIMLGLDALALQL